MTPTTHFLKLFLGLTLLAFVIILAPLLYLCRRRRRALVLNDEIRGPDETELVTFHGWQHLKVSDILEAPGEVIGKSNYGTLYKAFLQRENSVLLLRFLRPVCTEKVEDLDDLVQLFGQIKHPNLVPLLGFYGGPRGEKLLVHPYYEHGNLTEFVRDGNGECHKWAVIHRIAFGIAQALGHLHTGLHKPLVHGNLKSNNILLDRNCHPHVSDFGLHRLLNPAAAQEMLEACVAEGYNAPELIKDKEATQGTDIYCLGVILLELLTGREPVDEKAARDEDYYIPNLLRNALLCHNIADLLHPGILVLSNVNGNQKKLVEERVLKLFQLAMACCSPSPSFRPDIKQVLLEMAEMGR